MNFVRFCGSNKKIQLDYVTVFPRLSAFLPFVAIMSVLEEVCTSISTRQGSIICVVISDHDHTRYPSAD